MISPANREEKAFLYAIFSYRNAGRSYEEIAQKLSDVVQEMGKRSGKDPDGIVAAIANVVNTNLKDLASKTEIDSVASIVKR